MLPTGAASPSAGDPQQQQGGDPSRPPTGQFAPPGRMGGPSNKGMNSMMPPPSPALSAKPKDGGEGGPAASPQQNPARGPTPAPEVTAPPPASMPPSQEMLGQDLFGHGGDFSFDPLDTTGLDMPAGNVDFNEWFTAFGSEQVGGM